MKIALLITGITLILLSCLRYRNRKKEIALVIVSLIFSVFILEIFLRLYYPQIQEHDKMFEYDSYLGWRFIPNKRGSIVYRRVIHHNIKTNSLGFRDNPIPSGHGGMRKILVLGDSFVSNLAVRDNDVFTEVIEQQLKNTIVLNFGVNGYGQTQEYLLLKKHLDKFNPDLVILVIYVRNDFQDNVGGYWLYPRPVAYWSEKNSTLTISPTPGYTPEDSESTSFWDLHKQFHTYKLFKQRLFVLLNKLQTKMQSEYKPSIHTIPELYLCRKDLSEDTKLMYRTTEELLLKIASFVDDRNLPLVFVIAPSIIQVEDKLWLSTLEEIGVNPIDFRASLPNERLMKFAQKNNLCMIDLLPILKSQTAKGNMVYNRMEQHWNRNGNRIVAYALLDYIKTELLGSSK